MLRAAIYVGRLVWNRRRTHKHPDTGRAHRRPNDPEDIVIQDVPEHRIVDAETWEAAQARLARDAAPTTATGQARFWETRRPHYLLTGKVVCGCCGALFTTVGKDYLACRARRIAACPNATRVRRGPLEAQVLDALGSRLMAPALVETFVREFTREWNRLAAGEAGARTGHRTELAAVERKIANLVEALAEGVARSGAVSTKVAELDRRADVLRAAVSAAPPGRPRLHPRLAKVCRDRVARIRDAMAGVGSAEALEAARALIDQVIGSGPTDGGGPPDIELVGDLPEMLKAAGAQPFQRGNPEGMARLLCALASSAQGDQGGQSPPDSHPSAFSPPPAI